MKKEHILLICQKKQQIKKISIKYDIAKYENEKEYFFAHFSKDSPRFPGLARCPCPPRRRPPVLPPREAMGALLHTLRKAFQGFRAWPGGRVRPAEAPPDAAAVPTSRIAPPLREAAALDLRASDAAQQRLRPRVAAQQRSHDVEVGPSKCRSCARATALAGKGEAARRARRQSARRRSRLSLCCRCTECSWSSSRCSARCSARWCAPSRDSRLRASA